MKILWLSHFIPYPPIGGAPQRSFHLMREVAERHTLILRAFNLAGASPQSLAEARAEFMRFCADVEFWQLPFKWKGTRWWMELGISGLRNHPLSGRVFASSPAQRRLRRVLAEHPDAVVHVDSIDLAFYVPLLSDHHTLLHHHNCESAMTARRAENEPNPVARAYLRRQADALAALERSLCPAFDMNVAVSSLDADSIRSSAPGAEVQVVENGTDDQYFAPMPDLEEPNTIVFAGSLNWYPNVSAVRHFASETWPQLKARVPGVRWYLAGMCPVPEIRTLAAADSQITLVDTPTDIRPWIARGAVFVCPIVDGGGTRLKLLDALAMGKAAVSSPIGCEGLAATSGEHVWVAEAGTATVDAIETLLGDPELRRRLGCAGRRLVAARYSWKQIAQHLEQAYEWTRHDTSRDPHVPVEFTVRERACIPG